MTFQTPTYYSNDDQQNPDTEHNWLIGQANKRHAQGKRKKYRPITGTRRNLLHIDLLDPLLTLFARHHWLLYISNRLRRGRGDLFLNLLLLY